MKTNIDYVQLTFSLAVELGIIILALSDELTFYKYKSLCQENSKPSIIITNLVRKKDFVLKRCNI